MKRGSESFSFQSIERRFYSPPIDASGFFKTPEQKEREPWSDRTILITGASGAIGREAVRHFRDLGAKVVIGTTSQEGFDKTVEGLPEEKRNGVHPFVSNFEDPTTINEALRNLDEQEIVVTDVLLGAAANMGSFLRPLVRLLARASKDASQTNDKTKKMDAYKDIRPVIEEGLQDNLPQAQAINYTSHWHLIQELAKRQAAKPKEERKRIKAVFLSSLQSSKYAQETPNEEDMDTIRVVEGIPLFYIGTAQTKAELEKKMKKNGPALAEHAAMYLAIASASSVNETGVGKAVTKFVSPGLSDEEQTIATTTPIEIADYLAVVQDILESDEKQWNQLPLEKYVIGTGNERKFEVTDRLDLNHPVFQIKSPF